MRRWRSRSDSARLAHRRDGAGDMSIWDMLVEYSLIDSVLTFMKEHPRLTRAMLLLITTLAFAALAAWAFWPAQVSLLGLQSA